MLSSDFMKRKEAIETWYQDPTPPSDTYTYNTYGVTCTEVEVDVLTGEREILRTDILNDCGER